ncbi:MAG: hypothetical protein Crog4KO_06600 [Crocinitomicaceae bacterium]
MSPELRCYVKLTREEKMVLKLLIQGYSSKKITSKANITLSSVKSIRIKLLSKFKAKSTIHMIVLATLDLKYYNLLTQNVRRSQAKFSDLELRIIFLILQGYTNDETASKLDLSSKLIKSKRSNLRKKLSIKSPSDYVLRCIQFGLLMVVPRKFNLLSTHIKNNDIKLLPSPNYLEEELDIDELNDNGFIYFDTLNRFNYIFRSEEDGLRKVEAVLKALNFSDLSQDFVFNSFKATQSASKEMIKVMYQILQETNPKQLIKEEINVGSLEINVLPDSQWPEIYSKGQPYLVRLSLMETSDRRRTEFINLSLDQLNLKTSLIAQIWSSESTTGVLMTFLHLNFFKSHHI